MQELASLTKSFGAMHGWALNGTGTVLLVKTCWFGLVLTGFSACVAFPRLQIQVMGSASFVGAMRLHDLVSDLVEAPTRNRFVSTVWRYMAGSKTEIDRILGCTGCTGCDVF